MTVEYQKLELMGTWECLPEEEKMRDIVLMA